MTGDAGLTARARSRIGIAHDYLPKPDNDPAPAHVDAGEFVMPTAAEINDTRLEVERHKRRLLESAPVTHGEAAE